MATLDDLMLSAGVTNSPTWFGKIKIPYWAMPHQLDALKDYVRHTRFMDASDPGTGKTYPAQTHAVFMAALGNKVCFTMPPKLLEQFEEELLDFFVGIEKYLKIGNYSGNAKAKQTMRESWDLEGWPDILLLSYDDYRVLNDFVDLKTVPRGSWRHPEGGSYWKSNTSPLEPRDSSVGPVTKDGRTISKRGKAKNPLKLKLLSEGYNVLFFDEGHALCGTDSIIAKAVKKASDELKEDIAVYVMTGTPVPTHLENAYGLIRLINPEAYACYADFARKHCVTTTIQVRTGLGKTANVKTITGYKATEAIHKALFANARRVQKGDVLTLPEPLISQMKVRLSRKHMKLYKAVVNDMFAITSEGSVIAPSSDAEVRAIALRLVGCPDEFDPELSKENELAEAADAFIESVNPANFKIIIFAFHKSVIKFLADRYRQWNPAVVNGESVGPSEINKFKTDDTCRIAIVNWVSGGAGLNLQIAHHILFYECPTSPRDAKQAIARCYRKGQANIVNATFLRVMKTVSDKNFKNLLKNEESNNEAIKDKKDLLYEVLKP